MPFGHLFIVAQDELWNSLGSVSRVLCVCARHFTWAGREESKLSPEQKKVVDKNRSECRNREREKGNPTQLSCCHCDRCCSLHGITFCLVVKCEVLFSTFYPETATSSPKIQTAEPRARKKRHFVEVKWAQKQCTVHSIKANGAASAEQKHNRKTQTSNSRTFSIDH